MLKTTTYRDINDPAYIPDGADCAGSRLNNYCGFVGELDDMTETDCGDWLCADCAERGEWGGFCAACSDADESMTCGEKAQ